jgi:hypothetical protein
MLSFTVKEFANYTKKNENMLKIGQIVKSRLWKDAGMVEKVFNNWEDLKQKTHFSTIDSIPEETSSIERLINDPKDEWLRMQEIPFTNKELNEKWYLVRCLNRGSFWSCESKLELVDSLLN